MKTVLSAVLLMSSVTASHAARDLPDIASLVQREGPAVVNISTSQTVVNMVVCLVWRRMIHLTKCVCFNLRQFPTARISGQPLGSGFIISNDIHSYHSTLSVMPTRLPPLLTSANSRRE